MNRNMAAALLKILGGLVLTIGAFVGIMQVHAPGPTPSFAAVPVLNSPAEFSTGGNLVAGGQELAAGRRTMFDMQMPSATTTGDFYCSIQNNETYDVKVQMGWGLTAGATTTVLSSVWTLSEGEGVDLIASSTDFFAPNSHVVLNIGATTSAVSATHNPKGGCSFLGTSY